MQRWELESYVHPGTREAFKLMVLEHAGDEVVTGTLSASGDQFPIVRGVPRFSNVKNYADNFGFQWTEYAQVQLDSRVTWGGQSQRRLREETRWPDDLRGQSILEMGSGAGRFTELLARTGATLYTCDYSSAIDANKLNNGTACNVAFSQADIYAPPFRRQSFDKILCIGVLQHCPDPERAFRSLVRYLKPGGEIVIDVYRLDWTTPFFGKYYVRPLTKRMSSKMLQTLVRAHVAWLYPVTGLLHRAIGSRARYLSLLLSMADYRGTFDADDATFRTLSELDTFDMLSPAFDKPQLVSTVRGWFASLGMECVDVRKGFNGVQARGRVRAV